MTKKITCLFLFLVYLASGVLLIKDYGINWDEPAHFMRGQTFLRFFLTGKKDFQDLPLLERENKSYFPDWGYQWQDEKASKLIRQSIYQYYPHSPNSYFYTGNPQIHGTHPVFSDIMSALSNYLFFVKPGWVDDIHAYGLYPVFLSAVLVGVVFWWVSRIWDSFAGLVAALSLGLYPLFLGERHFNIKDVPQTVFFALALMMFFEAATRMSKKYLVLFIAFASMAFATKLNFGFAIFIIFPWLGLLFLQGWRPHFKKHKLFWLLFLTTPLVMISFLILTWPAIWFEPKILLAILKYHEKIGTSVNNGLNLYAWKYLLFTTPVVTLIFALLGIIFGSRFFSKKGKQAFWLVILWFLVPMVRVSLPKTNIYGGVRQIMEYVPALVILSGIGAAGLWSRLMRFKLTKVWSLALVLLFAPTVIKMVQLHPNESVFFNSLIGGLKGAKEQQIPDWGQSLGNSYRQGVEWLNQNAEPKAKLALGYELLSNIPWIWLRNDIEFKNELKSGPAMQGEYLISQVNNSPFMDWYHLRYLERFLNPVYQVQVDGVSILKIWKNDPAHVKKNFSGEEHKVDGVNIKIKPAAILLNLPKTIRLTRLEFVLPKDSDCQVPAEVGAFYLKKNESSPNKFLPAIHYDFGNQLDYPDIYTFRSRLDYPEPFFVFAAEEVQTIEMQLDKGARCLENTQSINVWALAD